MATPVVPDLGPFVLVQAGIFIVTVGGGLVFWWRGLRKKFQTEYTRDASAQYFFDGPLKIALDRLEGAYRVLGEMRHENETTVVEFRGRHEAELDILRELRESSDTRTNTLKDILEQIRLIADGSHRRLR